MWPGSAWSRSSSPATWPPSPRRSTCSASTTTSASGSATGPPTQAVDAEAPTGRPLRSPLPAADGVVSHPQGSPTTAMGWAVQPDGLRRLLVRLHAEYTGPAGVDLYVTENGVAYDDQVAEDGQVHDADRTDVPGRPPGGRARRGRRGRPGARLLLLVADGQLRVGLGLRQALRRGPGGLRHPAAHGEGLRPRLRPDHRRPQPCRERRREEQRACRTWSAIRRSPTPACRDWRKLGQGLHARFVTGDFASRDPLPGRHRHGGRGAGPPSAGSDGRRLRGAEADQRRRDLPRRRGHRASGRVGHPSGTSSWRAGSARWRTTRT